MTTPVSFELAKLLKEKGYLFEFIAIGDTKEVPLNIPTISEVVMWLYEKYGIWISVTKEVDGFDYVIDNKYGLSKYQKRFNSPKEAYEAAIDYALKNLIQEEEQETKVVNLQDKERQRIYEKILNRKME